MAEKEYVYGVGPEASGIGRFLSPLLPVRREVIEPYQETFIESPDPGKVERVVTPGQYGDPELAVPEAVQAFLNFKGLARDPEAREAVLKGIAALPGMPEELSRRAQMSAQAAMAGERGVYDPKTGTVVGAEEALLAVPLLNAPGTALSIARAGDATGTVMGMMGGSRAQGPVGKAAKEAEDLFNEGRRETAVYRKTGAIRATENKPAVPIEVFGEGGLDVSKLEDLLKEPAIHASRLEDGFSFTDYVAFPNVLEAYPELKNAEFRFLESDNDIWEKVNAPILVNPFYDPAPDEPNLFYIKSSISVRDNNIRPQIYGDVKSLMAVAIQDYISQKEGFVRPRDVNPAEASSPSARNSERARKEYLRTITEEGQTPSPAQALQAAQLGYLSDIDQITRSDLSRDRQRAMNSYKLKNPDEYRKGMVQAYGAQQLDKYPLYFGQLMGDMNFPAKFTIEYQSPLFDIVEDLPQEKGTGNQFLAAIKKAGVKQEDLLYSGLEVFLANNKSVTKSEIRDRLYEREVPVYEKFLEDEQGKNIFYPTSYTTGNNDRLKLAPEAQLRDPRSLALVTQTDPLTGVAATGASVGLHDKLPENTFAHMRFNTRTVRANGEPVEVLFIDEIQSDWHQRAGKMVSELIETEAPDAQGKKSGKIIGGKALEELIYEKLEQVPDIQYDSTIPNKIADEAVKKTEKITGVKFNENSATKRTYRQEYAKAAKKILGISDGEIKARAKKTIYGKDLPDAAFKDNWHELSFRRLVREAVEEDLDGVAFTPDYLQNLRYGKQDADPEDQFSFYNKVLAPYVTKYAKRNGTELKKAGLRFADDEAMEAAGYSADLPVYYMPLSDEIKKMYRKPIPTYAMGGGVGSMAPVARNMFRGYDDIRRGVGAYAPYTRRA